MSRNDCSVLTGELYALERVIFDAVDEDARPAAEVTAVRCYARNELLVHREPIRVPIRVLSSKKRKIRVGAT